MTSNSSPSVSPADERKRLSSKYHALLMREISGNFDADMAELLVSGGKASVNELSPDGVSPLSLACSKGKPSVVSWLLSKKAKPNAPSSFPFVSAGAWKPSLVQGFPLHAALASRDNSQNIHDLASVVSSLISAGADLEKRDAKGRTPLVYFPASLDESRDFYFEEPSRGERLSGKSNGQSAAANVKRVEILRTLLDAGAKPDRKDSDGLSPVFLFVARGDAPYVAELSARGLLSDPKNSAGVKASESAAKSILKIRADLAELEERARQPFDWDWQNDEYHSEWCSWKSDVESCRFREASFAKILSYLGVQPSQYEKLAASAVKKEQAAAPAASSPKKSPRP